MIMRYILSILLLLSVAICSAQETDCSVELFSTAATGKYTPFWIVSNRYGVTPLISESGYMRATAIHSRALGSGFRLKAGADMVIATARYSNVYMQQLFAELRYGFMKLSIGSCENYTSLYDRELSSGDLVASANARPVPEINISVPQFTVIPLTNGWLQFRGEFAVGRSFDTEYLERMYGNDRYYVEGVLWHHKALHIRIADTQNDFPFSLVTGIRHHAQWGGTSTNPKIGKQPSSIKDFVRIVLGKSGDANATESDQINVLGNHFGAYDFKLGYLHPKFSVYLYKEHYYEDASGMELYNFRDGLYGLQLEIPEFMWLNKAVLEFIDTRDQSGPFHYLDFDHAKYDSYGGGSDQYYKNGEYNTGVSYFGRGMGTPLVQSPEYGYKLGFFNNRIRAFHAGLSGYLSSNVAYRLLLTSVESWGTMGRPFFNKATDLSYALKISYCHPRLDDYLFNAEIACDKGTMYSNGFGGSISVIKNFGF